MQQLLHFADWTEYQEIQPYWSIHCHENCKLHSFGIDFKQIYAEI